MARRTRCATTAGGLCLRAGHDADRAAARETTIREHPALSPAQKEAAIISLNGDAVWMKVDAQHRIVLAAHLVQYLNLEREVYMFSTNSALNLWHPAEWQRWSELQRSWQPPEPLPPEIQVVMVWAARQRQL